LELAVIPVIFVVQTAVSFLVSIAVSKGFGFKKRHANFVTAMGVSLILGGVVCRVLTILGIRKLELATNLTRHLALTNIEGFALGQSARRQR
jgi:hypothetical protein